MEKVMLYNGESYHADCLEELEKEDAKEVTPGTIGVEEICKNCGESLLREEDDNDTTEAEEK